MAYHEESHAATRRYQPRDRALAAARRPPRVHSLRVPRHRAHAPGGTLAGDAAPLDERNSARARDDVRLLGPLPRYRGHRHRWRRGHRAHARPVSAPPRTATELCPAATAPHPPGFGRVLAL